MGLLVLLAIPVALSLLLRVVVHWQTWAYFSQAQPPDEAWQPAVSIIVPVKGLDERASENFQSLCEQDYAGYEIIFALETEDEPAVPVIQALGQRYPDCDIRMVFSTPLGINAVGKVKNLIAGYGASRYEAIALIDSDVHLAPDFLRQSVGFVTPTGAGAAFAAPVCEGSENWVAALHNIAVNLSTLNYGAAAYQQRTNNLVGSIILTRRDVLEAIGGLDAIAHRLVGIDVSLGQAIHKAGYTLGLLNQPARMYHSRDTIPQFWWQIHRWLVTIRHYFPNFPWVMVLLALPLWWALLFLGVAVALGNYAGLGVALVGAVLLADVLSVAVINQRLVKDRALWRFLWAAALSEIVTLPIFIHSLFSNKVLWRGRWLSLEDAS